MVTYTSSSTYWAPLKPRIRIYEFSDSTYSSPLYTYNPFTDVGTTTKPVSLTFDSQIDNAGTFSIEIEDTAFELDPDTYSRGNRVYIDCSKDGSTFQPAFKGLVRGIDQNIYATSGRNIVLNGYSYLVRLNERILNVIKESTLTGTDYDRTDSNMFTDNLINDLLTTNSNYVYSDDDTALYNIFKKTNITSSPIVDWIPRLDAQLVTVNDAINSVLEFSNGLIMLNPSDDELVLYSSDLITSGTGIFLLTHEMNQAADDADYTMYPLQPYKYNVSYDYADFGSRLIGSIGEGAGGAECPETEPQIPGGLYSPVEVYSFTKWFLTSTSTVHWYGQSFLTNGTEVTSLAFALGSEGDNSSATTATAKIYTNTNNTTGDGSPGTQIGSDITLHKNGIPGTPFPSSTTYIFDVQMEKSTVGPTVTPGQWHYLVLKMDHSMTSTNRVGWIDDTSAAAGSQGRIADSTNSGGSWTASGLGTNGLSLRFDYSLGGQEACGGGGGSQATKDADPVFSIAHDRNMSSRLGVVERVITGIPTHIKTKQTLQEYLFNKLYFAAKPRFAFDFPSVSMPNKIPKAGDIITHVDSTARIGTSTSPIQTGVISSVEFDFAQGADEALGLRKLAVSTSGIKRGSY